MIRHGGKALLGLIVFAVAVVVVLTVVVQTFSELIGRCAS